MTETKCELCRSIEVYNSIVYVPETEGYEIGLAVRCKDCGTEMRFLGLPIGRDNHGATTSPCGTTAYFAVKPVGEPIYMAEDFEGYKTFIYTSEGERLVDDTKFVDIDFESLVIPPRQMVAMRLTALAKLTVICWTIYASIRAILDVIWGP